MGIKNFIQRKMMERQMKDLPKDQRDKMMGAIEKNPELFEKISKETQQKMKEGKGQMAASMEVMRKYQNELRDALGESQQ